MSYFVAAALFAFVYPQLINSELIPIDYLIVAGGGTGGDYGAGGGAGGMLTNVGGETLLIETSKVYVLKTGSGGAWTDSPACGGNGFDSEFGTLVAFGGSAGTREKDNT